jgi:hypothetical protein
METESPVGIAAVELGDEDGGGDDEEEGYDGDHAMAFD